jgi:hypothetical protein
MIDWLHRARRVRRDVEPDPDILAELFRVSAASFRCPQCGATGLVIGAAPADDDEAWGMARKCDSCCQPIAPERLEALPDARLCAACQAGDERGQPPGPVEYCARCGSVMVVRPSRGPGVTRYTLVCPDCRR